jgi:ParB family transcriptional regulator, chromosome partitioning protein
MVVKKHGLGRGLDALLGGAKAAKTAPIPAKEAVEAKANENAAAPTAFSTDNNQRQIPVEFIQPGKYQPRQDFRSESLEELASSIKQQGVMQPIVVRTISPNRYEIIAGERRWRATQLAGLDKIPVIIKEVPDNTAIAMALIENIQREDLNPMEEAVALHRLQEEFSLTQQEVADAVGKSRAAVANLLRLINLQSEVRTFLERGDLEMGHARSLLALGPEQQVQTARVVVAKGLSVRQTEALVRGLQSPKITTNKAEEHDADIKSLQDELAEKLGAEVVVEHTAKGKGRLVVKYSSLDQLDGILARIR